MQDLNGFMITPRDRVLRAWQNSTELVRDYQDYAREWEQEEPALSKLFAEFAESEAAHAARLLVLLKGYDKERRSQDIAP